MRRSFSQKCFTLNDLFKVAGRKGDVLGMDDASLYFDGTRAVAASEEAVVWIDCPQPLESPALVPVSEIRTALAVSPLLSLRDSDGHVAANGVRVFAQRDADERIPAGTRELIDLPRETWRPVVRPFRFDGSRLSQLAPAAATGDLRHYLNGVFFDFAAGALAATDGARMHVVEDCLPVIALPADTLQGVVLPQGVLKILSHVGGVQEVFVLQKTEEAAPRGETVVAGVTLNVELPKPDPTREEVPELAGPERLICIGVANAKFRIRAVRTVSYPGYRVPFERNREHPIQLVIANEDLPTFAAVARVAAKNENFPGLTIEGEGRRVTVSHVDRFRRDLAVAYPVGEPFSVTVNGEFLLKALEAGGSFGSAITMRYSRADGRGVYVGALDFHAVVMTLRQEELVGEAAQTEAEMAHPA